LFGYVSGSRLNTPAIGETHMSVRRKGATPAQLEELYRARFEHFSRVASAVCRDPELGRDAVQAAFATAVRQRRAFRGSGPLEAWVWRIVVNEARRLAREPRPQSLVQGVELARDGQGEDPLGLRAWIAALPERQREVLFFRYYADLDYRTIADALGIEVGTVSATLSAAHQALRRRLEGVR
jgi:RNA polymerase sigma-70 factor (ECF subfamily)